MKLSDHFTLEEFIRSETAQQKSIVNVPTKEHIANMKNLCKEILEPLRAHMRKPILISSGYRSAELNRAIGGAEHSQHTNGEAADLVIPMKRNSQDMAMARTMINYILQQCHFDQLILEHNRSGTYWIHVSLKKDGTKNRLQYIPNLVK